LIVELEIPLWYWEE